MLKSECMEVGGSGHSPLQENMDVFLVGLFEGVSSLLNLKKWRLYEKPQTGLP